MAFSVSPLAVSNTYSGIITLKVTGLTSGSTVVVQKFLDANANGVIDRGDWLVQQFQLTDGQAGMVIGGIVNSNVPGDTDTTAGQITARLNFRNGDLLQTIGGKYLYRLSSPTGRFTPMTNPFSVTNFPYPQKFTGKVVIGGTSTAVPNAILVLQRGNAQGGVVGGVVADSSGSYTMQAPPGTYSLLAVKSNYVSQVSEGPTIALGGGSTVTTDPAVFGATASISGKLVDANDSGIGLPGILLSARSGNGLMAVGTTDTNGNFTLGVQSGVGQWALRPDDTSLIVHGYPGPEGSTYFAAGQTGVTLAVPKATALFYGSVKDNLENPLPGIDVYANDSNSNLYETDAYTDANGNYFAGVVGGLGSNDPWWVRVSTDSGPADYIFAQPAVDQNNGTDISDGQAVLANITALLATHHISGSLEDSSGNPIADVQVQANGTINGTTYQGNVDTGTTGNYSLNLPNGSWNLAVSCTGSSHSLDNILGSGNYQCPNSLGVTIENNNGTADFTVLSDSSGQIFGYVTDTSGNPVVGVDVYAHDGAGDNYSIPTDGSGYYSFNVGNGNWDVSVDCGGLSALGYQCVSDQNVNVSNGGVEQGFTVPFAGSIQYAAAPDTGLAPLAVRFSCPSVDSSSNAIVSWNWNFGDGATSALQNPAHTYTTIGTFTPALVVSNNTGGAEMATGPRISVANPATQAFTTLYNFGSTGGHGTPAAGLVLSGSTLYGTAIGGGASGSGTVFKLNTDGTGFTNLYSFSGGADGANPQSVLFLSGNTLYGTASGGGASGNGAVFRLNTDGSGFTNLHGFTATETNSVGAGTNGDGAVPWGSSVVVSGNTLYGTASGGGASGNGTVFALNTNGADFTALWTFSATDTNVCNSDGAYPNVGLAASGNSLYGTTFFGGSSGIGTVFRLSLGPVGSSAPQLTILRSGTDVILGWPGSANGYTLESTTNLGPSPAWSAVSPPPVVVNGQNTVTNPVSGARRLYRLSGQ